MDTQTVNSNNIDKLKRRVEALEGLIKELVESHNIIIKIIKAKHYEDLES